MRERRPQCGSVPIAGTKLESHIWHLSTVSERISFKQEVRKKASGLTFLDSIRSCNACTNFFVPFICLVFLFRIWTANIE